MCPSSWVATIPDEHSAIRDGEVRRQAAKTGTAARCSRESSFHYDRHVTTTVGCYRYRFCIEKWNGENVNSAI
jgi:hypothetical protein